MNEKGKEVSPNLDSQICVYSDTSNEGYGRYVFYLDSAGGNVFVKDRGLYIDSMSSYCDASKVNYELYGNMSGRDMICSKKKKKKKKKKVREKSRECHNHKPQPFPDPKRKKVPTNPNKHKSNKRTKSTKISSLFPSTRKDIQQIAS